MSTLIPRETGANVPYVDATGTEFTAEEVAGVERAVGVVAREVANWVNRTRSNRDRSPSLFNRVAYVAPDNPISAMEVARTAVEHDDVLGGVCDVTEGLIFQGLKWESEDEVATDVFNQIARDLNLDEFAREWHREEFTYSQVVVGLWWDWREYKLRSKTGEGKRSKAKKRVWAPVAWTLLPPTKVIPLKPGPFGQDRLAWNATKEELAAAVALADGTLQDPVLREFTVGRVTGLDKDEETLLTSWGIDPRNLLRLNPDSVFRYCRTKPSYERFPTLRLKSTFALLDLKQQLIEADRVSLVGAANFILLVRQGTDEQPAKQEEIDNLKENFKVIAKLPVIIGDHRLSVDIITPDQEWVLSADKYDTIDRRLLSRALGALTASSSGQRNESTITVARGVARLLESRRHMMKRVLEEQIARAVVDHPNNEGLFKHEPNLAFTPRNVQLDADSETVRALLQLRTQKEISRESTLEWFGLDQAVEAMRREIEEDLYDDIFQTQIPFNSPLNGGGDPNQPQEPPQQSGGRGGRPPGGGDSAQSPQGQSGQRNGRGQRTPGS